LALARAGLGTLNFGFHLKFSKFFHGEPKNGHGLGSRFVKQFTTKNLTALFLSRHPPLKTKTASTSRPPKFLHGFVWRGVANNSGWLLGAWFKSQNRAMGEAIGKIKKKQETFRFESWDLA
jgi:hypothetical protein